MINEHRKKAEEVIVDAIKKRYPNAPIPSNFGGYVLKQLIRAGYAHKKVLKKNEPEVRERARVDCGPDCFEDDV